MRRILALVLVISVALPRPPLRADEPEDAAVARVKALGGTVTRDAEQPGSPVISVSLSRNPFRGATCRVGDADLKGLAAFKGLTSLALVNTDVTDAGLKELSALKNLTTLHLDGTKVSGTRVTEEGLKGLAPLVRLTTLDLGGAEVTDRTLAALRQANLLHALPLARAWNGKRPTRPEEVERFDLRHVKQTDAAVRELAPLKNLKQLHLSCGVTDAGLRELGTFKGLTTLTFGAARVTAAGFKELAALPNLATLVLSGEG